jgi:hypothetical protein
MTMIPAVVAAVRKRSGRKKILRKMMMRNSVKYKLCKISTAIELPHWR